MKRLLVSACVASVLFVGLLAATASATETAPWPMRGHDAANSAKSPYDGPGKALKKWELSIGGELSSPVVAADGTIYVVTTNLGTGNGRLFAIGPNGKKKWQFLLGPADFSENSLALGADGTVYAASDEKLFAVNPDGTKKWEFATTYWLTCPPVVDSAGVVYVAGTNVESAGTSTESKLYAVSADGTKKWESASLPVLISYAPAIDASGTAFVVGMSGDLSSLDPTGPDSKLIAIGPDGVQKWSVSSPTIMALSPVVGADGAVHVVSLDLLSNDPGFDLVAFNPDGTTRWTFKAGAPSGSGDPLAYFGTGDGLYAVNSDGSVKWRYASPDFTGLFSSVASGGVVYSFGDNGSVYSFSPAGTLNWKLPTGSMGPVSAPAVGTGATLYVTTSYGKLLAIGGTPTSISIFASPTSVRLPKAFVLSGVLKPGQLKDACGVEVRKPGKSYWSYSSARLAYSMTPSGGANWWYRYSPKLRGYYYFRVKFAGDATRAMSVSRTISVRVR